MPRLAIIAGQGALPLMIADANPEAVFVHFGGLASDLPANESLLVSLERLGELFDLLRSAGTTDVVFAGGLPRPELDPGKFDSVMMEIAPLLLAAMQGGDDGLLRTVIEIFEERGFAIRGAHELLDGITAAPGRLAGPDLSEADRQDAARAHAILDALGPLDVGQAAVVAGGQVLGVETAQGTDAMLSFVAGTPRKLRRHAGGVLVKAPKASQDLRVDMPAIGPGTIAGAKAADLAGIVIDAGTVLVIDRAETEAAAEAAGLFLIAEARRCGPS